MSNLIYFYTGAMNCGKTNAVIQVAYNYKEGNGNPLVIKPAFDTRDNNPTVLRSRSGSVWDDCLSLPIDIDSTGVKIMLYNQLKCLKTIDAVIIDEVQFLTVEQIKAFYDFCRKVRIPLIAYGLRNSFTDEGFPASDWLLRNGKVTFMKSVCWCKAAATHNMLLLDGVPYNEELHGKLDSMRIGGNESYQGVCYEHFLNREPRPVPSES